MFYFSKIRTNFGVKDKIKRERKKWVGYLLKNNSWITSIIEENIEGKPGRPRQSYIKQIMLDLDKRFYRKFKKVAIDREE
jgi:hypothetical protein